MTIRFLEEFKNTKQITLKCPTSEEFEYNIQLNNEKVSFRRGHFVTLDNLWDMNSQSIEVHLSMLVNEDMTEFLDDWRTGRRYNIDYREIMIDVWEFDFNEIMSDIPHHRSPKPFNSPNHGLIESSWIVQHENEEREIIVYQKNRSGTVYFIMEFPQ